MKELKQLVNVELTYSVYSNLNKNNKPIACGLPLAEANKLLDTKGLGLLYIKFELDNLPYLRVLKGGL